MPFGETKPNCLGRTKEEASSSSNGGGPAYVYGNRRKENPANETSPKQVSGRKGAIWRNEAKFFNGYQVLAAMEHWQMRPRCGPGFLLRVTGWVKRD